VAHQEEGVVLLDSLTEYIEVDTLELMCEECNKNKTSTDLMPIFCQFEKQLSILTPPNILFIQLKRFDAFSQKKIAGTLKFPLEGLDISTLLTKNQSNNNNNNNKLEPLYYDLMSVICHFGTLENVII
jgi:ubiquitin C-terminal hydrolase